MLALLLSWLLLASASWRMGGWIFRVVSEAEEPRDADVLDLLFLGLIGLAPVALFSTWFIPGQWGGLLLLLLALAGSPPPFFRRRPQWPVALVFLLSALVSLGWVSSRDSITYHHDLIHLLSNGGVVRGMGWIHGRFGYISSWHALTSWLHQPQLGLASRMDTAVNGFLLGLCLLQMMRAARRWMQGEADVRDTFSLVAWSVTLPLPVYLNFVSNPTPDFPVIIYAVVAARWLLVSSASSSPARDARVALLIGCAAFAIKLSALPIAAVCGLTALYRGGIKGVLVRTCCLGAVPVLVWMLSCWWVTGYPLYPTTLRITDVSWQIPEEHALTQKEVVYNFAFWGEGVFPDSMVGVPRYSVKWMRHWIVQDEVNLLGGLAFVAGIGSLPFLFGIRRFRSIAAATALLGLGGSIFLALMAPAPRFGLGFLLILPACLTSCWLQNMSFRFPAFLTRVLPVLLVLTMVAPTWLRNTRSERRVKTGLEQGVIRREPSQPWLRPPLVPHLHFDDKLDTVIVPDPARSHNTPGTTSNERATWYQLAPFEGGEFVDPAKGWKGGFRRSGLEEVP